MAIRLIFLYLIKEHKNLLCSLFLTMNIKNKIET
jgi:hypothetical protein